MHHYWLTLFAVVSISSVAPVNGSMEGGYTLTITGVAPAANASDLLSVSVAGRAATSFTFVSRTQIVVLVPSSPSAVTGAVTVTSQETGQLSFNSFTYLPRTSTLATG
jgi:hypothetical protein